MDETQTQVSGVKDQVLHMDLGGSYRDVTLVATKYAIHWFFKALNDLFFIHKNILFEKGKE